MTIVCVCAFSVGAASPASKFLALDDGQRFWYLEGAIQLSAHLIATGDKSKGECVGAWYLKDRAAKRQLIEDAIAKNPDAGVTTTILVLLEQACGRPLIPAFVKTAH